MGAKKLEILVREAQFDQKAMEQLIKMFDPLIIRNSIINGVFDEDCSQELKIQFIKCIKKFKFEPEKIDIKSYL